MDGMCVTADGTVEMITWDGVEAVAGRSQTPEGYNPMVRCQRTWDTPARGRGKIRNGDQTQGAERREEFVLDRGVVGRHLRTL